VEPWDIGAPPDGPFEKLAAQFLTACALRDTGEAVCWGRNSAGHASPPATAFSDICLGESFGCGITLQSEIECWGAVDPAMIPAGPQADLACEHGTACSIDARGAPHCWTFGAVDDPCSPTSGCWERQPPDLPLTDIATSKNVHCAIQQDRTIACWGRQRADEVDEPPAGTFSQISGKYYFCGLRDNRRVDCWGYFD
jgi:hypothetical protein